MQKMLICFALFLISGTFSTLQAEGFDAGLGFALVNPGASEGSDKGFDIQLGYELPEINSWYFGTQLHAINGLTSKSDVDDERANGSEGNSILAFDSQALYLTARPENWWVQFNAGMVHANYYTLDKDASNIGTAVGIGVMVGSEDFRLHMFDFHWYQFGGDSFFVYSFSIFLVPGAM
ncbi:hypothetical protein [Sulfurimonas sp. HSL3-7]|uniref:hypothetical protein n=1 Tax=Sulfonitrofixus jiaomeiensis TaxID=3131938 RepID=UPI0031F8B842